MQGGALLLGECQEGLAHLRKAYGMLLGSRHASVGKMPGLLDTRSLRSARAHAVDEDVVHDGQKPGAQIAVGAKGAAPLIGAHQRVVDEVLRVGAVARQRTRIAPQRAKLPNDIEACHRPFHALFTEPGRI
jgi:hypothetical protein